MVSNGLKWPKWSPMVLKGSTCSKLYQMVLMSFMERSASLLNLFSFKQPWVLTLTIAPYSRPWPWFWLLPSTDLHPTIHDTSTTNLILGLSLMLTKTKTPKRNSNIIKHKFGQVIKFGFFVIVAAFWEKFFGIYIRCCFDTFKVSNKETWRGS